MKKLRLKALKFGVKEILTRDQLKSVMGGFGSGTCCWHNQDWNAYGCGLDRDTAQSRADDYASNNGAGNSGYWCCDSC